MVIRVVLLASFFFRIVRNSLVTLTLILFARNASTHEVTPTLKSYSGFFLLDIIACSFFFCRRHAHCYDTLSLNL
jgi:hypothetical protein